MSQETDAMDPTIPLDVVRLRVAQMISMGYSNNGIADDVRCAPATVSKYRSELVVRYHIPTSPQYERNVWIALKVRADPEIWTDFQTLKRM